MDNPETLSTLVTQNTRRRLKKPTTQTNKQLNNTYSTKNRKLTKVLVKSTQFRSRIIHSQSYSHSQYALDIN
jgi:hypothetical protein